MMASRFALLPDDDPADAPIPKAKKKADKKKAAAVAANNAANKKKNKTADADADDLKALAFGGKTKKNNNKKKNKNGTNGDANNSKESSVENPDFNDWAARDAANVRELYQEDLQKAMMESKISFEEEKTEVGPTPSDQKYKHPPPGMYRKQNKQNNTVSLDQFQAGMTTAPPPSVATVPPTLQPNAAAGQQLRANFFDSIKRDANNVLTREDRRELLERSARVGPPRPDATLSTPSPPPPSSSPNSNATTTALRAENDALRHELFTSKDRCKKLLSIIAECELKEKAQLIIEAEKLRQIRDELTENVTTLNGELEQQRSKVAELATALRKLSAAGKRSSTST